MDYKQPQFYRFNSDSLALVKAVLNKRRSANTILDLGAGCGIMGIELSRKLGPHRLILQELQRDYEEYLEENAKLFVPPEVKVNFSFSAFSSFKTDISADIIICNPPYYLPGHGQESGDLRRRRARSFQEDNWNELLKCIERHLSKDGEAFLVVKNDQLILDELMRNLPPTLKAYYEIKGKIMFVILSRLDVD